MSTEWMQAALTPPDVVQVTVKLGVIEETDHCQWMVEVSEPTSGVLIAQASNPHDRWSNWPHMLDSALAKAQELLGQALDPF